MSIEAVRRNAFQKGEVHEELLEQLSPKQDLESAFEDLEDFYHSDGLPEYMYDQVTEHMIEMWDTIARDPEHLEL